MIFASIPIELGIRAKMMNLGFEKKFIFVGAHVKWGERILKSFYLPIDLIVYRLIK
jgi:hypothetical protein